MVFLFRWRVPTFTFFSVSKVCPEGNAVVFQSNVGIADSPPGILSSGVSGLSNFSPEQVGAGIKIKSLIALANAKLLVSTTIGVEGTGLQNNIHCIVEDEFPRQAEWIIQYLDDKNSRNKIIIQGRAFILEQFSKKRFYKSMDQLFSLKSKNQIM